MPAGRRRGSAWLAVLLVGLTACGQGTAAPVAPPPAPATRTERWIDLAVGDCLAEPPPDDPGVVTVTVVDCAAPHAAETYARIPVPVNTAIAGVAGRDCTDRFTGYTGRPVADTSLAVGYLIDSDQDRTDNNPAPSTVICLLQNADGALLTGSARR